MASKYNHISYHKPSGLYIARYTVTLPNGTRKRQAVYGKTKEEAKAKYDKEVANAINNRAVQKSNLTVETFILNWVDNAPNLNESTRYHYLGEIRKYILPQIGKKRLSSLTTSDIQNLMNQAIKNGASPRTTQILRNILSRALRYAEARCLVQKDIMRYIELESYTPKERVIWTRENVNIFRKAILNHKYRFFFELYITYGLRRGEAIPLCWKDIDLKNGVIHITKQYTYMGKSLKICSPKTPTSKRDLPILPHIRQLLEELHPEDKEPDSLVISRAGNQPIKPSSINYAFKKISKENNLPKVTLHSLRHFTATSLKDAGVSIKDAQGILGHSNPLTTIQHYQHSNLESKTEALKEYAKIMGF